MSIPEEIRAIPRPKNTVVIAYGKNKNLYAVRQRTGCIYKNGRRLPVSGEIIGHIINNEYVPLTVTPITPVSQSPIELKGWGAVALANSVAASLLDELCTVYSRSDALKIYCVALLRVCNPGIKDRELKDAYEESFLSELYPNVALSKNTICVFWKNLGKAYSRIVSYMSLRVAAVEAGHHLIIDGTLKANQSTVNTLSEFSRKARVKGSKDISILYAYDLETMEPICSKCFPGNMIDSTAYESFLAEYKIKKGIIVGDKGFPSSCAIEHFEKNVDLHYLNPLKRDSRYITPCNLLIYTGQLPGHETVMYKKAKANDCENKWLYSFRYAEQAYKEESSWLHRSAENEDFDISDYDKESLLFGTLILESDLDMTPLDAFLAYESRWEIELVMRYYKQACEFDETRVHNDYSIIASEFCNLLASIITHRLLVLFDRTRLLEKRTYREIMKILRKAKKCRMDDNGDWNLVKMNPSQIKILQELNLLSLPEPKKRGRKPGNNT